MINGMQTLLEIEEGIEAVKSKIDRLDTKIDQLFTSSQENKVQQSQIVYDIAKIRFHELAEGNIDIRAENIEKNIKVLLDKRVQAYDALAQKILQNKDDLKRMSEKRNRAHLDLDEAAKEVIEKEYEIQEYLEKDTHYQSILEKTRKSKNIMQRAIEKANESESTRIQKGIPYEKCELFMYLWKEKYGTPEYKNKGITKVLDSWVASFLEYEKDRVNYWTLLEIPKRLKKHEEEARLEYKNNVEILSKIEHEKAKTLGLQVLHEKEMLKQEEVDKIDDNLVLLEKVYESMMVERQGFAKDEDQYALETIDLINQVLEDLNIQTLEQLIKETPTTKDDTLLQKLNALKDAYLEMQNKISQNRNAYDTKMKQLHEMESLREKFKRNRYDDIRSGFNNQNVIEDMIGGLLGGLVQSDILWDTLKRSQQHVDTGSWPDFGSGGFESSVSPWHVPQNRDGGISFNFPDNGGFSSRNTLDDFSTGGGF